jgi:molybdopterin-containing oxidoreductase family membrane subunit
MDVTISNKETQSGASVAIPDSSSFTASVRKPLVTGGKTIHDVTEDICRRVEDAPPRSWLLAVGLSSGLLLVGLYALLMTLWEGIGMWGLNKTVGWAWDITNFVWWVGIGHAGTLISAILLLFRQKWRTSINRAAEAMTIFAVICAAVFPVIHMGRPWLGFYWALPLPNTFGSLWVNFNSPLLWDVFAISTYFSVSLVFWYIGLVPDFATIRDRATNKISKAVYGALSLGWVGGARNWERYESVSLILAGVATPLVLSVHTIVSFDFATSVIPGWHTTIFPPYFVAGAIFSGFAMVLTLMLITRKVYKLEDYITVHHIELMNIVIIVTGSIVGIAYITEFFIAWYSGVEAEQYAFINRMTGPYWWAYWSMMTCNVISPQLFWFKKIRTSIAATFIISIIVNIGMWFERFVIIVTSLHRDFLPSSWAMFYPTIYDIGIYLFTFGFFFTAYFLFAKFFPVINMAEVKAVLKSTSSKE